MICRTTASILFAFTAMLATPVCGEECSATRTETTVRAGAGSGGERVTTHRKVTKDGVVVEESGDPPRSADPSAATGPVGEVDGAALERELAAKVQAMLDEMLREVRADRALDSAKKGTGSGGAPDSGKAPESSKSSKSSESSDSATHATSRSSSSRSSESSSSSSSSSSDERGERRGASRKGAGSEPRPESGARPGEPRARGEGSRAPRSGSGSRPGGSGRGEAPAAPGRRTSPARASGANPVHDGGGRSP